MSILTALIEQIASEPDRRLEREQLREAAKEMLGGGLPPALVGGFLAAMRVRGEQASELTPFVEVMLEHATSFPRPKLDVPIVDTCGTGGDGHNTFNISTAAALVAAAAGVAVAKHGNRSASSKCGSADVLEAMGYNLDASPEESARQLETHRFCFLFARNYHPSMKHAAGPRKDLGVRTLFNVCGPLSNPARPSHQLVGVSSRALIRPVVESLKELGVRSALVVHGGDGMDEISLPQTTEGVRLDARGDFHSWSFSPDELDLHPVEMAELVGGDAAANAEILRRVLGGQKGPHADVVNLNVAGILWTAGIESSFPQGFAHARSVQESGAALELLERLLGDQQEGAAT